MPRGSRRAGRFAAFLAAALSAAAMVPSAAHAAPFVVNQLGDAGDGTCDATCTLRDAIDDANANADLDNITFQPALAGNPIALTSQLDVTGSVTIDGRAGGSLPAIDIDGNLAGVASGLTFTGATNVSTVRGLAVTHWGAAGLAVDTGARLSVHGSMLGINLDGSADGNGDGIMVANGAGGATIGAPGAGDGNVISGNGFDGIYLEGNAPVTVQNNWIGTNTAGTAALGAQPNGVVINDGSGFTVGGDGPDEGNVISGNTGAGVSIEDATATGNTVEGNLIGLGADGTTTVANTSNGVNINAASSGNVVSGNTIAGGTVGVDVSGDDARVEGNTISGTVIGVSVAASADRTTIGGSTVAARNVLSGNTAGIQTNGPGTKVFGNYIGLAADGLTAAGNTTSGVIVQGTADNAEIGGANAGEGNVIGSNGAAGVVVRDGPSGVRVRGNSIGINTIGEVRRNGSVGVRIFDAANNSVGGTTLAEANTIAFSSDQGVNIARVDGAPEEPAGNQVLINSIRDNGALGIDLNDGNVFGRTLNDDGDLDAGTNGYQNFPVLRTALDDGASTEIYGTLNSLPNTTYRVRLFSNPGGTDQAETYIGEQDVTTDGAGNATFFYTATPAVALGRAVTATATDAAGSTSEISDPVTVQTRPSPQPPTGGGGPPAGGPGPGPGPPGLDPRLGVLGFRAASFKSGRTKVTFKLTNRVTYPIDITVTGREGKVGRTRAPRFRTARTTLRAGQTKTITLSIPSTQRKAITNELKKKTRVVRRLDLRITNRTGAVSRSYKPRLTVRR